MSLVARLLRLLRRFESRIQNPASPISIAMPTTIAAMPHPVGKTKTARKMARMSAI